MAYDKLMDSFQATDKTRAHNEFCTETGKALDQRKDRAEVPTAFLSLLLSEITVNSL